MVRTFACAHPGRSESRPSKLVRMRSSNDQTASFLPLTKVARYADFADHGFAAFVPKPFDLDALLALVGSLLPGAHGDETPVTASTEE